MTRYLLILMFTLAAGPVFGQEGDRLIDLRGSWYFRLGDEAAWASPAFDDSGWDEIFVPGAWEDEGFWGYDGFAWYRKHFKLPRAYDGGALILSLGRVDDVDHVFVNGHFVGSTGRLGDEYQTGYQVSRAYRVPAAFLNPRGDNVVAVRVFDEVQQGGILEGFIGLTKEARPFPLAVDLSGLWDFRTGDNRAWARASVEKEGWDEISVPGRWEPQGYDGYDGYAWYRRTFTLPAEFRGQEMVIWPGLVDDLHEVYVNGRRVGGDAGINAGRVRGDEWQQQQRYVIPPELLRYGGTNVIAIRVYDGLIDGGIYEGPVGLMLSRDAGATSTFSEWLERLFGGWFR